MSKKPKNWQLAVLGGVQGANSGGRPPRPDVGRTLLRQADLDETKPEDGLTTKKKKEEELHALRNEVKQLEMQREKLKKSN